jgi:hypothetical protein
MAIPPNCDAAERIVESTIFCVPRPLNIMHRPHCTGSRCLQRMLCVPQPHTLRLVGFEGRRPQLITSFMLLPGIYSCPRITSTMTAWSRYRGPGNRPILSFPVSGLQEGMLCLLVRNSPMQLNPLTSVTKTIERNFKLQWNFKNKFSLPFWHVNVLYFVLRVPLGKSWARCQEYAYVIGRYGNGLRT